MEKTINFVQDFPIENPVRYLFLFILLPIIIVADDQDRFIVGYDVKTDLIADNYEAGAFLIYDCVEKHWVCVLEEYSKDCHEKRLKDLESRDSPIYSCAPIGVFPNKRSCFQRMLFMITHNHGTRFCIKSEWKQKAVDF
jgi:hypothetical protein